METDVLVVGAGPVGLLLAAELALAGARPLVVERLAERSRDVKARLIGPLATEALRRRGIGAKLAEHHERGVADFRRDHGSDKGHFAWIYKVELAPAEEPERTRTLIWQPDLERLLDEHVASLGVRVLRGHTVTGLYQGEGADTVVATVRTQASERRITARYLVGCDGGRSTVRKLAGFDFPGTAPLMVGRAARVELANSEALPTAGRTDTGTLSYGNGGMIGAFEFGAFPEDQRAQLTAEELEAAVRRVSGAEITITSMRNPIQFLDHARQSSTYRLGRVLLAGDAAHVHSPNGGQGLNLGLMDAVNLGWKLGAAIRGEIHRRNHSELLDSYTTERHPIAAVTLNNTRAQSALLRPGAHTDALRDILSELMDLPQVKAYFTELMTGLHRPYELPYATDKATHPLLGRHSPDFAVDTPAGRTTLYELADKAQTLLLAPPDCPAITDIAEPWVDQADRFSLIHAATPHRPGLAAALVRPDGVIAWAASTAAAPDAAMLRAALHTWCH